MISATLGTSGVVFAATDHYRTEPDGRLHSFCHAVPGKWHLMGVMLSAGGSFEWFCEVMGQMAYTSYLRDLAKSAERNEEPLPSEFEDYLTGPAAAVPAGSEGLLFLPYLTGERTPHADPNARGAFVGLTARHGLAHLTRAVLEGVSFGLRDSLELMRALGVPISQVRASGGGAKSAVWRQILADVFNAEIATVNVTQGAAYGAALLAGVGVGVYADVAAACETAVSTTGSTRPGDSVATYEAWYPRYRALYPALAREFAAITEVVGGGGPGGR